MANNKNKREVNYESKLLTFVTLLLLLGLTSLSYAGNGGTWVGHAVVDEHCIGGAFSWETNTYITISNPNSVPVQITATWIGNPPQDSQGFFILDPAQASAQGSPTGTINATLPGQRAILFDALSFARQNGIVPSSCPIIIGFGDIYWNISWSTQGNEEIVITTVTRNAPTDGTELHWNGKLGDNTAD